MQKTNKLAQFKQWILSIVRLRLLFEKEIERRIKELDLQLTNAKNRDIRHLESVAIDLLDCEKPIKDPLTTLYITRYSVLDVNRILELSEFIDMNNPFTINVAMGLANKGYSNKLIIEQACKANEA